MAITERGEKTGVPLPTFLFKRKLGKQSKPIAKTRAERVVEVHVYLKALEQWADEPKAAAARLYGVHDADVPPHLRELAFYWRQFVIAKLGWRKIAIYRDELAHRWYFFVPLPAYFVRDKMDWPKDLIRADEQNYRLFPLIVPSLEIMSDLLPVSLEATGVAAQKGILIAENKSYCDQATIQRASGEITIENISYNLPLVPYFFIDEEI